MTFHMIFTIYNRATYIKSAITVKSVTNMQEKFHFSGASFSFKNAHLLFLIISIKCRVFLYIDFYIPN